MFTEKNPNTFSHPNELSLRFRYRVFVARPLVARALTVHAAFSGCSPFCVCFCSFKIKSFGCLCCLLVTKSFLDRSRGGMDDLACDGCIERRPGFAWCRNGLAHCSRHDLNRLKRCLLCDSNIPIKRFRDASRLRRHLDVESMPHNALFVWLGENFSEFDFAMAATTHLPLSVCLDHILVASKRSCSSLDGFIASANERLSRTSAEIVKANHCDGTVCYICYSRSVPVQPRRVLVDDSGESDHKSAEPHQRRACRVDGTRLPLQNVELITRSRTPWRHSDARLSRVQSRDSVSPTSMSAADVLSLGDSMSSSVRRTVAGAARLAELDVASPPSASVIRRDATRRNKLFSIFFKYIEVDAKLAPVDGALFTCSELVDFIRCVIFLRGRTVDHLRLFRLSCDGGQGDLKISCQLIFYDDSMLSADSESPQPRASDNSDFGVKRTFILSLMCGASETYESLSLMFNSLNLRGLKELLPRATFVFPVDMKLSNIVAGLGPVGCSNPYLYTLWSPYVKWSRPDVVRTVDSLFRDGSLRVAHAGESNERKGASAKTLNQKFNSSYNVPMEFVRVFVNEHLSDFFVPAQLHILLGIAKDLYECAAFLSPEVADLWLGKIGVRHDDRHGRSGFVGNDCRKMTANWQVLVSLVRESRLDAKLQERLLLIATALGCFHNVVTSTMSWQLVDGWRETLTAFDVAYAKVASVMQLLKTSVASRSPERLTPKLKCLLEEVPLWIARNKCSLARVSEQSFETLHHDYLNFSYRYSIPRTGVTSRSGGTKNRKRKRNDDAFVAPRPLPSQMVAPDLIGNVSHARTKRMQCLLAFNLRQLPPVSCVQMNIETVLAWSNGDKQSDPPWKVRLVSLKLLYVKVRCVRLVFVIRGQQRWPANSADNTAAR